MTPCKSGMCDVVSGQQPHLLRSGGITGDSAVEGTGVGAPAQVDNGPSRGRASSRRQASYSSSEMSCVSGRSQCRPYQWSVLAMQGLTAAAAREAAAQALCDAGELTCMMM